MQFGEPVSERSERTIKLAELKQVIVSMDNAGLRLLLSFLHSFIIRRNSAKTGRPACNLASATGICGVSSSQLDLQMIHLRVR